MKNTFLKTFLSFITACVYVNNTFAFNPADTSKAVLTAPCEKISENKKVLKEANVIYPEIFFGHEKESMGYVAKFSVARKDYLIRTFKRSKKYFPKAIAILKKQNMPAEFAVLLALESGFNGNAVSGAGAVGYWQFMDNVAKEYGLKIAQKSYKEGYKKYKSKLVTVEKTYSKRAKVQVDDRKNFIRSTYAAARYLKDRSRNLNSDWL
ncbi:MAG: transglycosylase SLT domain-containing protein, partial [Ferruginibacter sp.]